MNDFISCLALDANNMGDNVKNDRLAGSSVTRSFCLRVVRHACILLAGGLLAGCTTAGPAVHVTLQTEPPLVMKDIRSLAVDDFQYNDPDVGRSVADAMMVHMNTSGLYTLIERSQLDKIRDQLKISVDQMHDPKYAQMIGKLAGADAMVLGSVVNFIPPSFTSRAYISVQFRVVSVGTGKCLLTKDENVTGDLVTFGTSAEQALDSLMQEVSTKCAGKLCGYEYCTRYLMKGGRYSISRTPNQLGIDHVMQSTTGLLWKDAESSFEKALKEEPNNAGALNNLAIAYEVGGNNEKAAESYEKAYQLCSHDKILDNFIKFKDRNAGRGAKPVTLLDRASPLPVSAPVPYSVQAAAPMALSPAAPQSPAVTPAAPAGQPPIPAPAPKLAEAKVAPVNATPPPSPVTAPAAQQETPIKNTAAPSSVPVASPVPQAATNAVSSGATQPAQPSTSAATQAPTLMAALSNTVTNAAPHPSAGTP